MINIKKYFSQILTGCTLFFLFMSCMDMDSKSGSEASESKILRLATSGEYPPFEYKSNGKLTGFDIELGRLIAKKLGKKAEFKDMKFSAIFPSVQSQAVDGAISSLTITKSRKHNFDFSIPYHLENMAMIFRKKSPIDKDDSLEGKKIACQIGTTMETWLQKRPENVNIVKTDSRLKDSIRSLKSEEVDGVLVDILQAEFFIRKNPELDYTIFVMSEPGSGYALVFRKGSTLTARVNKILKELTKKGTLRDLKRKYKIVK